MSEPAREDPEAGEQLQDAPCQTREAVLTVEEQYVGQPLVAGGESAAQQFLRAAGFEETVEQFAADLCAAQTVAEAEQLLDRRGQAL